MAFSDLATRGLTIAKTLAGSDAVGLFVRPSEGQPVGGPVTVELHGPQGALVIGSGPDPEAALRSIGDQLRARAASESAARIAAAQAAEQQRAAELEMQIAAFAAAAQ